MVAPKEFAALPGGDANQLAERYRPEPALLAANAALQAALKAGRHVQECTTLALRETGEQATKDAEAALIAAEVDLALADPGDEADRGRRLAIRDEAAAKVLAAKDAEGRASALRQGLLARVATADVDLAQAGRAAAALLASYRGQLARAVAGDLAAAITGQASLVGVLCRGWAIRAASSMSEGFSQLEDLVIPAISPGEAPLVRGFRIAVPNVALRDLRTEWKGDPEAAALHDQVRAVFEAERDFRTYRRFTPPMVEAPYVKRGFEGPHGLGSPRRNTTTTYSTLPPAAAPPPPARTSEAGPVSHAPRRAIYRTPGTPAPARQALDAGSVAVESENVDHNG